MITIMHCQFLFMYCRLVAYLSHHCCTTYFWLYFVGHYVRELLSIYCSQHHSTKEFFRNGYSFYYLAGVGVLLFVQVTCYEKTSHLYKMYISIHIIVCTYLPFNF